MSLSNSNEEVFCGPVGSGGGEKKLLMEEELFSRQNSREQKLIHQTLCVEEDQRSRQ